MTDSTELPPRDFFDRGEHRLQFDDLEELFVARLLLGLVKDRLTSASASIDFTLADVFPGFGSIEKLLQHIGNKTVTTRDQLSDETASVLAFVTGASIAAADEETDVVSFYDQWMERRLGYLVRGDDLVIRPGTIRSFARKRACVFEVDIDPQRLAKELAQALPLPFEIRERFLENTQRMAPMTMPKIDHRKLLTLLREHLDSRTAYTGETSFAIDTDEVPFRHAIQLLNGVPMMSVPGTASAGDRYKLPMLLEAHGEFDIEEMFVKTDPMHPEDAVVHFAIKRPAIRNIYSATVRGLRPDQRRELTEIELSLYTRAHEELRRKHVFGGRPELEESFGTLASWLLRKLSYSLEEPSFLRDPALRWATDHATDKYKKFEDGFFLPFLHEKLADKFGKRIVKKPERFGGEIDILFDTNLPIELKVRVGGANPLTTILDEKYPAAGQAAAYAAVCRLGIVIVLDLPDGVPTISNLDSSVRVLERDLSQDGSYPTCIVVFVFHAHHPKPSGVG